MTAQISLPGRAEPLHVQPPRWAAGYPPPTSRRVFAAAHVAAGPAAGGSAASSGTASSGTARDGTLSGRAAIDWESTMRFRDHLWAYGFGIAEAMDTAQRGMGLSWDQARELITRSAARAAERRATGHRAELACGAGTDQLTDGGTYRLPDIIDAYSEQLAFVQATGSGVILMASRALAASARNARDYLEVYGAVLAQADRPVILHWLGEAFDPALHGYWGSADFSTAADTVLELIEQAGDKVDGIKLSVLDASKEVALRRRLPTGVRLYTGDDFNYAELIRGDEHGHSDALLGAFAAITAPAAAALHALDAGDVTSYDATMNATVPLSRLIFEQPTYYYKAGVAFLAWLNGFQPHFAMIGGLEGQRSAAHLLRVFELAAETGALIDPALAVSRMTELLATRAAFS